MPRALSCVASHVACASIGTPYLGRIVTSGDGTTYANAFGYHPSGAPLSYKPGGAGNPNPDQQFTYDNKRYWPKSLATGQRSLTYGYDTVGNIIDS